MKTDKYTKFILTAFAIGLFANAGVLIYQAKLIDEVEDTIYSTSYEVDLIKSTVNEIKKNADNKYNDGNLYIVDELLTCLNGSTISPRFNNSSSYNLKISRICMKSIYDRMGLRHTVP